MLGKLNKIKWSQAYSYPHWQQILDHNKLSYNNSKFENLQEKIVKLQVFGSIT